MIDFSKITGITLPPPPGDVATVTITIKNYKWGTITYNGVQHTTTFTANIGDTIEIQGVDVAINNPNATPSRTPHQTLNERTSYTVVSDATFEGKNQFSGNTSTGMYYLLSITDTPFTGVVTQIADESGRVLWSAVQNVTVTITGGAHEDLAWVVVDGVTYYSGTVTLSVPVGTVISCYVDIESKDVDPGIYLNGAYMAYRNYEHTVTTNATINLTDDRDRDYRYAGLIYITEQ